MRLFVALFFLCVVKLNAQTYNVGTPVYDTLVFTPGSAGYSPTACPLFILTFDSSITHNPAGTQVYFKIVSATMAANSLHELTNGILNVGDSFAVTPTNCSFQFYSSVNGFANFNFAFLRTGIPTVQGDSFTCKKDIHEALSVWVDGCGSELERNFYPAGWGIDSCAVDGPLYSSAVETSTTSFTCIPNPTSEKCTLEFPSSANEIFTIEVMDEMGRIVKTQTASPSLNGKAVDVDVSALASGVYTIRATSDRVMYTQRMVKR